MKNKNEIFHERKKRIKTRFYLFLMICVPFILSDRFRPKSVKF
jgi:hypothetical protein